MPRTPSIRRLEVEQAILELASQSRFLVAARLMQRFGFSRQAAAMHLRRMVERGELIAEGETRRRLYRLPILVDAQQEYPADGSIREDRVWSEFVVPRLRGVAGNVRSICHYGVTEMANNVLDHSGSNTLLVQVERTAAKIEFNVFDHGVGIFKKIREAYQLEDDRHAILELVKGKLTTDPARHTGEGIFYTARMFDEFSIVSGKLGVMHEREKEAWIIEGQSLAPGTLVHMSINANAKHTDKEVFEKYSSRPDDYAFSRTRVLVDLARTGAENLVSRSQAKRLLARLDEFQEIILDFQGVETIGPAFADEIFRVFRAAHPTSEISPKNTTEEVSKMIRRALGATDPGE